MWGWFGDEGRLRDEWRVVVSIHPQNIGCQVEQAVDDFVRHAREAGSFEVHLPHAGGLPDLDEDRLATLRGRLEAKGCPDPVSAARIVAKVLYPIIRKCSGACMEGRAAVRSRDMQLASVRQLYKPVLAWLQSHNLLVLTTRAYQPGVRSRLYTVNVPLILWLLAYRTSDLAWKWVNEGKSVAEADASETDTWLDADSLDLFGEPRRSNVHARCAAIVDADR